MLDTLVMILLNLTVRIMFLMEVHWRHKNENFSRKPCLLSYHILELTIPIFNLSLFSPWLVVFIVGFFVVWMSFFFFFVAVSAAVFLVSFAWALILLIASTVDIPLSVLLSLR